jgi:D-alanyl-D-alanine dipeptidase
MTDEVILLSDPRLGRIDVDECGHPLIDLRRDARLRLDARKADPAGAYAHVRSNVAVRLIQAQSLLPVGFRLLVIEGYRPPALQRFYFERYVEQLRRAEPGLGLSELHAAASRYVSPPDIAPHSCGAAVDLTICTPEGLELDLGTAVNTGPEASDNACYMSAANIQREARHHRSVLRAALSGVGFVNYPTEWWHWSFGDRYWALMTGRSTAMYGPIEHLALASDG